MATKKDQRYEGLKARVDSMIEQLIALVPNQQEADKLAQLLRERFIEAQHKVETRPNSMRSNDGDINDLRNMTNHLST